MGKQIKNIAPLQAAKLFAVMYFIFGALFAAFMALIVLFAPTPEGNIQALGIGFILVMPFLYAILGFVGVAVMCWLYNVIAKKIGGIEITIQETSSA